MTQKTRVLLPGWAPSRGMWLKDFVLRRDHSRSLRHISDSATDRKLWCGKQSHLCLKETSDVKSREPSDMVPHLSSLWHYTHVLTGVQSVAAESSVHFQQLSPAPHPATSQVCRPRWLLGKPVPAGCSSSVCRSAPSLLGFPPPFFSFLKLTSDFSTIWKHLQASGIS